MEVDQEVHASFRDEFMKALSAVKEDRTWRGLLDIEREEKDRTITYEFVTNNGSEESLTQLVHCKCLFGRQLPQMPKEYIVRLVFDRRLFCLVMKKKETVIPSSTLPSPSPTESANSKPAGRGRWPRPPTPEATTTPSLEPVERETVVAAVCFRPFGKFAEIAFLAVSSKDQVRGYGTRLMNHLKEALKTHGVTDLVTYADNAAVGYFSKQGFYSPTSAQATKPASQWHDCIRTGYDSYIKDYDGANKMVCCIYKDVNYLTLSSMKEEVQAALWKAFLACNPGVEKYPGLHSFPDRVYDVPGLEGLAPAKRDESPPPPKNRRGRPALDEPMVPVSTGNTPVRQRPVPSRLQMPTSVEAMVHDVIETALSNGSSWPFKEPVDVSLAPDYYQVIRSPMDLATMRSKNVKGLYKNLNELRSDFKLMFDNCLFYNGDDSVYATAAQVLDKVVSQRMERLEQMSGIAKGGSAVEKPRTK